MHEVAAGSLHTRCRSYLKWGLLSWFRHEKGVVLQVPAFDFSNLADVSIRCTGLLQAKTSQSWPVILTKTSSKLLTIESWYLENHAFLRLHLIQRSLKQHSNSAFDARNSIYIHTSHSYYDTYVHIRKRASGEPQTAQALPSHNCHSCSPTLNTGYLYSYITQVQTKIIQGHHSHHTYLPNLQMYVYKHIMYMHCPQCCPIT